MNDTHAYTSDELDDRLRHVKGFLGCFAIDALPARLRPGQSLIVNQDRAAGGGTHWMAVASAHGLLAIFDPFGGPPDPRILAMGRASTGKVFANTLQYQPATSSACGPLSAYFIDRIQHHDPYVVLYKDLIPSTSKRNSQVALRWMHSQEGGDLKVQSQAHIGPQKSQEERVHGLVEGIAEGAKAIKGGPGEFAKWAAQIIFNRMKGLHENTQLKTQIKLMWGPDGLKMYEARLKENPEYMPKEFIDEGAKRKGFDTYEDWFADYTAKTKSAELKKGALFMKMRYGEKAYKDYLRKHGIEYGTEPWRAEYDAIVRRKGGSMGDGMYRFGDANFHRPTQNMRTKQALTPAQLAVLGSQRTLHGSGRIDAYCMRCKKNTPMVSIRHEISKNGMNMLRGQCEACSCNMCKITGKAKA